jgi:MFS family permease
MLTALGAALLLSGIIGAIVVFIVALLAVDGSETAAGITSLAGVLATLFLSYLMGGYAAGRVSSRKGTKHGVLAALLGVVVTILLVLIGTVAGFGISDNLSGVVLPDVPAEEEQQGLGSLLAFSAISGILILILPFIGGAVGGAWGARTGRRRP